MSSILRVAARVIAMTHPTDEAMKKYLHDHPGADPRNHKVDKSRPEGGDERYEDYEGEKARVSEGDKKKVDQVTKDIKQWVKPGTPLHKVLKSMHKGEKLPPRLVDKALKNMKALADNEKNPTAKKTLEEQHRVFKHLTESYGK